MPETPLFKHAVHDTFSAILCVIEGASHDTYSAILCVITGAYCDTFYRFMCPVEPVDQVTLARGVILALFDFSLYNSLEM